MIKRAETIHPDLTLNLQFTNARLSSDNNVSMDEYYTKKFVFASKETSINYIESAYLDQTHPLAMDAKGMHELGEYLKNFSDDRDRRQINDLIDQIDNTIESKDIALQETKEKLDEAFHSHEKFKGKHETITSNMAIIQKEGESFEENVEQKDLEDLTQRLGRAIEKAISQIPVNYKKIDVCIIEMVRVVMLDKDNEAEKLIQQIEEVDLKKKYYKREKICKLIYQHYRNNLRINREKRNTLRSEMMDENTSMLDINLLVSVGNDEDNPYAAKLQRVTKQLEGTYKEVLGKSGDIKVDLNKLRIKFAQYDEKNIAMKDELLEDFQEIFNETNNLHEIFSDILIKDFCLAFGLLAKSRLYMNRDYQRLIKTAIHQYVEADDSNEYLKFLNAAEAHMAPRISTFCDSFSREMRKMHKTNTEEYLMRRFDDMDEKNPKECYKEVQDRCKYVHHIMYKAEEVLKGSMRKITKEASKNTVNNLIYQKKSPGLTQKISPAISRMEEQRDFINYHYDPAVWKEQREKVEGINTVLNHVIRTKEKSRFDDLDQQTKDTLNQQYSQLKVDRNDLVARYHGVQNTGKKGKRYLYSYSEYMRKFLVKLDDEIRKTENYIYSSQVKIDEVTGEPIDIEKKDKMKAERYMEDIKEFEEKLRNFNKKSNQKAPWTAYAEYKEQLDQLDDQYKSICQDPEVEDIFTSIGRSQMKDQRFYHRVFKDQVSDLLEMNKQLYASFGTISIESLREVFSKYRIKSTKAETALKQWRLDVLQPEIDNMTSDVVSRRLAKINSYNTSIAINLSDLIALYRKICKFLDEKTEQIVQLIFEEDQAKIEEVVNKIKLECTTHSIRSFTRPFYYEVFKKKVMSLYI